MCRHGSFGLEDVATVLLDWIFGERKGQFKSAFATLVVAHILWVLCVVLVAWRQKMMLPLTPIRH